jgi:GTPase SAR1 family protein
MNNTFSVFLLYLLFAVIITSFLRALFTYGYAVWKYSIKNGATFLWHEAHQDEELYRNYFFGPWRHQIKLIYLECRDIITLEPTFTGASWLQEKLGEFDLLRIPVSARFFLIIPMFWVWFFLYIYHFFERFFSLIFTAILLAVFTVLHTIIAVSVSGIAKLIMNFNRANEFALRAKSGRAIRCTHCLEQSTDCYFRCPQCQRIHKNLHPSRYGVWNTRCDCGYKLPLTHKGRQRNLAIHEVCPLCNNDLMFAMSKNFGIQLVGGSSSGKTSFLAAFWHEYVRLLESFPYNSLRYYTVPGEKFDEMEFSFKTGTSNATYERSAITYTISHELPDSDTMLNFSIYDIAGEVFSNSSYEKTQSQYTYCEGLIVLVDPLSSLEFRQRIGFGEGVLQGYSQSSPYIVLSSFLETYKNLNRYRKNLVNVPLSIIITKSDIEEINQRIGLEVISGKYKAEEFTYGFKFDNARDVICKEFLFDIDFSDFLQLIDANFKNVHYFPVSAMGHNLNGEEYQPEGILDSVRWLFSEDLKKMVEKSSKIEIGETQKTKKVEYVKPDFKPVEKPKPPAKIVTQAELEKEIAEEEANFRKAYEEMEEAKKEEQPGKSPKQYIDPEEFFKKKSELVPEKQRFDDNLVYLDEPLEEYIPPQNYEPLKEHIPPQNYESLAGNTVAVEAIEEDLIEVLAAKYAKVYEKEPWGFVEIPTNNAVNIEDFTNKYEQENSSENIQESAEEYEKKPWGFVEIPTDNAVYIENFTNKGEQEEVVDDLDIYIFPDKNSKKYEEKTSPAAEQFSSIDDFLSILNKN